MEENLSQKFTLRLKHTLWACGCPDWGAVENWEKYGNSFNPDIHGTYIDPSHESLIIPDSLLSSHLNKIFVFTGSYYKEVGFPKDIDKWNDPVKGKVFRYTKCQIVN